MTDFHKQLLQLSKQKTELIKQSKSEELVKLLVKEKQFIQQIEQIEDEREVIVDKLYKAIGKQPKDKTVTELLTYIDNNEQKQSLEKAVTSLIEQIVLLRESEHLNTSLLQQSMQFVQLTLDMIQPESKNIHYGNHAKNKQVPSKAPTNRSVFDSKV